MTQSDAARRELVDANHILAHEGVLDAFGHVSLRDPSDAGRYLLSRSRSPEIVADADIRYFTLDSTPMEPDTGPFYMERVIHGGLYQLRPDVNAVCHFHAPPIMPFCVTGMEIVPVTHLGATMGAKVPLWSGQENFGDTNMLVSTAEEGASLARAMGANWSVLMANHGAVVAGRTLREAVFRAIHFCRNAEVLGSSLRLGSVTPLTAGEIRLASEVNLQDVVLQRAWDYWLHRMSSGGDRWPRADTAAE